MNNVLFNNNVMGAVAAVRRPRTYRHRPSQLLDTFSEEEIRDRYRFRRDSIEFICDIVDEDLRRPTRRNHALSVETQVLASLSFLASGCFYQVDADILGIDKSSVCRVVLDFCNSIVSNKERFVKFPFTDEEKNGNKLKFFHIEGFPSCILSIDGFHVRICTPFEDENSFVCRKGYHSINCQTMSDADMKFADFVVRWPGCTHDSFIFRSSEVHDYLRDNHTTLEKGVVLGDSGYALTNFLMTPYENPSTPQQRRFNVAHKTTRCSVERAIGELKRRFSCLKSGLRVQPEKACIYISACMILHHIAKILQEEDFEGDDGEDIECDPLPATANSLEGTAVRDHIANTFFA